MHLEKKNSGHQDANDDRFGFFIRRWNFDNKQTRCRRSSSCKGKTPVGQITTAKPSPNDHPDLAILVIPSYAPTFPQQIKIHQGKIQKRVIAFDQGRNGTRIYLQFMLFTLIRRNFHRHVFTLTCLLYLETAVAQW